MGTYDDSKISVARKDYDCITPGHVIKRGDRYLRYRWGLYDSSTVCLKCATTARRETTGSMYYDCGALRRHMGGDA